MLYLYKIMTIFRKINLKSNKIIDVFIGYIIDFITKIFDLQIKFCDEDDSFRNIKLKDYNLNKFELLYDNDLSNIHLYKKDISTNIYYKFSLKCSWQYVMNATKRYYFFFGFSVLSLIFFILLSKNYLVFYSIEFSISILFLYLSKRRLLNEIKSYYFSKCLLDFEFKDKKFFGE